MTYPKPDTIPVEVRNADGDFTFGTPLTVPQPDGKLVTYQPWSDGLLVGYRITRDDGRTEYLYFNPSNNDDGSDDPNVFVYEGTEGDPALDRPSVHFVQRFEG